MIRIQWSMYGRNGRLLEIKQNKMLICKLLKWGFKTKEFILTKFENKMYSNMYQ